MPEKISQKWLLLHGFYMVHVNPNYKGGFFRYYHDFPGAIHTELVVSFESNLSGQEKGEDSFHHEDGFMVWLTTDMTWIPLRYARTVDDLQALNLMLCGQRIEAAIND